MQKIFKIYIWTTILLIVFGVSSCKREDRLDHLDDNAPVPQHVTNIKVEPNAGGANIIYKLPQDPNLSYVKAIYEIRSGVFREAKASIYTDTLKLVGFGDTSTHKVELYSVGKNEKASQPLSLDVKPNTPPVYKVFESLDILPTFGGVRVTFENKDRADVAIMVMVDTTGQNTWAPAMTHYTSALDGGFASRGFEPEEKKFAIFVRDRWNNKSDTIFKFITPVFETRIPTNTWSVLELDTDQTELAGNFPLRNMWDGNGDVGSIGGLYASSNASTLPQWFTLDFGRTVSMSRFNLHMHVSHIFNGSAVKKFEIWGSNGPDSDGGWENWTLLETFESKKPSGLPIGEITAEDTYYGNVNGEEFEFQTPPPPVRYIRFKTLETYASTGQVVIQEFRLFGKIEE